MIKWFEPDVGRKDLHLVKKCILDNYINDGNIVTEFEQFDCINEDNNIIYK